MTTNSGILAVFKKDENMKMVVDLLAKRGYDVSTKESAFQAMAVVIERRADVVILDIDDLELKEMEFFDTAKKINPNLFILISCSHVNRGKAIKSLERGADFYISKPVYMNELLGIICKYLDRNGCCDNALVEGRTSIEQLALKVAHEINNPLTTISGQLQLHLSEMESSDPNYQIYTTLEEEAQRIAGVVKNLITYAYN